MRFNVRALTVRVPNSGGDCSGAMAGEASQAVAVDVRAPQAQSVQREVVAIG